MDSVNPALNEWMLSVKRDIEIIRDKNIEYIGQDKVDIFSKTAARTGAGIKNIPIDTTCHDMYEEVLPLMQTTWAQWRGYNNSYGALTGVKAVYDGRALAGCVPVALGQIMKFHEYPTAMFNYSIMPDSINYNSPYNAAADEVSDLLYSIAENMDAVYKPTVTNVDRIDIIPSLINDYGYTNATLSSYNTHTVLQDLRLGLPVYFAGGTDLGFGYIPRYFNGHGWVCDGFYTFMYCHEDGTTGLEYLYLHMNWGFNGFNNGYYYSHDFNQGGNSYNYDVITITGLTP